MSVGVITDSVSDYLPDVAAEKGITVIPLYVHLNGQTYRDRVSIDTDEVFAAVKAGAAIPTTSQPTPADFHDLYERLLHENDQVLVVTCSKDFSGTLGVAQLAAREFPGRVTTWDSGAGCGAQQMQAERAARLFRQGADLPAVLSALERAREKMDIRFTVGSLDFLRKNGRIGNATALLGQLLSIRPILTVTGGKVDAAGRARGDRRAFQDQVDNLKAMLQRHGRVRAFYLYTDQPDKARELKAAGDALGVECFGMNQMGAVISCHVGPGTFGACSEPVEP